MLFSKNTTRTLNQATKAVMAFLLLWGVIFSVSHTAHALPTSEQKTGAERTGPNHTESSQKKRQHGYKPYGQLGYSESFSHYRYVNPDAPKGGEIKLLGLGTFDNLNPYILAGQSPANTPGLFVFGLTERADTLLTGDADNPVGDEAGAAYGLIAHSLQCHIDLNWCDFFLRPEARFHDGKAITAEDVVFSFNLLKRKGHPRYELRLLNVEDAIAVDKHTVRFTFKGASKRDLPLVVGQLPILPKHYWLNREFDQVTLEPPLSSGPYKISSVKPGQQVVLERVKDYWGKDLPVNKGRYNFDRVIIDFYRDAQVAFESFKAGGYDVHLDYIAKHWATAYDFPAINQGKVIRKEIPHKIAQGTQGFFFNLRRTPFDQAEVRQALSLMFDFAWTNRAIFNSAYARQTSWFPNSNNGAQSTPSSAEAQLLGEFKASLPDELFSTPFTLPQGDGTRLPRAQIKQALSLLERAGWQMQEGKLVHQSSGQPMTFEVLIYHNPGMNRVILPWLDNLKRIGIDAQLRAIDHTSYKERMDNFDYDITVDVLSQRFFPGAELREYFHSSTATVKGSRNILGMQDSVVDQLVESVLAAENEADYLTALSALDRVLLWQHYIIPHWYLDYHRLAWWDKFAQPVVSTPYSLGIDTWWQQ